MRLHFLVFLSRLSKPILPIIYDPKVAALCKQLSLSHAWRKGASEEEMMAQLQAFSLSAQTPVSYQTALKELAERNKLNQKDLEDFVCSLK
jgi:polysaccharide pyruvyl transferase WcaK-like protein